MPRSLLCLFATTLAASTLLGGCVETCDLSVNDDPPTASILHPLDGIVLAAETPTTLEGVLEDLLTQPEDMLFYWESDLDGPLVGESELVEDLIRTAVPGGFSVGEHQLTLTVFDSEGQEGSDTVTFRAEPNAAPEIEILTPTAAEPVREGTPVTIVASVSDDYTAVEDLMLVWVLEPRGELSADPEISGNTVSVHLPEGLSPDITHVRLSAYDAMGAEGGATAPVSVEANVGPTATWVTPLADESYDRGEPLYVEVWVSDDLDEPEELHLSWGGLAAEEWADASGLNTVATSDGVLSGWLDVSACEQDPYHHEFPLELVMTDSEGATTRSQQVIRLKCLP